MPGQVGGGIAETAQVDDAPHACGGGGAAEGLRRRDVAVVEAAAAGHAVHQVVGDIDAGQGRVHAVAAQEVGARRLHRRRPVAALKARRVAHEHAHGLALLEQARHEASAHVAGGARDEGDAVFVAPRGVCRRGALAAVVCHVASRRRVRGYRPRLDSAGRG